MMVSLSTIGSILVLLVVFPWTSVAQTVADCARSVPESAKSTLCDIRLYRVTKGVETDPYLKCALVALGFAGQDGSIQRNIILSALDAVETHDGVYTDSVDACLSRSKKQPAAERAGAFYSCMLQTESSQNFKDALELQELKKSSLWGDNDPFDRPQVQQVIREVNGRMECK